jgi:hypothetical protein
VDPPYLYGAFFMVSGALKSILLKPHTKGYRKMLAEMRQQGGSYQLRDAFGKPVN